ncbi:NUDIX domain-containing protein [Lysinibacillus louembei]|uniref:NUDIX domain-containing protein n=1 Tax=Lysinibacillus louembei TaxID=1470088 RepID=A0ABZ0RVE9_9BACI|nr:NUDIX domain-containing protein [Lysinibacillus louembei]WPK11384.1 NUDIX domain-containing protein [Lysinibacillus louembei]
MEIKNHGYIFQKFIPLQEHELTSFEQLAGSYAIIQSEGRWLICYNRWRKQWELPAGGCEADETPKQCAVRELYEETGQIAAELSFYGVLKSRNIQNDNVKYNPVYYGVIEQLMPFVENEETACILLWDMRAAIEAIDEVDLALLQAINLLSLKRLV